MTELEKSIGQLGKHIKEQYPNDKTLWVLFVSVNATSALNQLRLKEKEGEVEALLNLMKEKSSV